MIDELIAKRIDTIMRWLYEKHPNITHEQKHLEEGTVERAYWNYGYLIAMRDIQQWIQENKNVN